MPSLLYEYLKDTWLFLGEHNNIERERGLESDISIYIYTTMNPHPLDDHMMLVSQLYPGAYSQIIPQQGETKPRRRRKKNKGGENGSDGGVKKRKLSAEQVNMLEMNFGNEHKLEPERKDRLASELEPNIIHILMVELARNTLRKLHRLSV
ncbi:hypothetical protein K1719_036573 [Acacia pycnantha]|nr:hypothetical protein K1719_036573 [Acacia pycnantha]